MIVKNINTKEAQNHIEAHSYSRIHSLYQAYEKPSRAKENAIEYCRKLCDRFSGYDFRIIGHNCMTFSVGFWGVIDGHKAFFYITKDYDRAYIE